MTETPPVVYLLHGEDEFGLAQFIAGLESKLGDEANVAFDKSYLDGRSFSFDELQAVANSIPFLSKRRLVLLSQPLGRLNDQASQKKFVQILERLPPTTALVIVEYQTLSDKNWLLLWARSAGSKAFVRSFAAQKGPAMARWIQDHAHSMGGKFTSQAAALLASLVGDDSRLADQEIQKLLAYADYRRPIDTEDVETLTALTAEGDIFALVDALGNQDGRLAIGMLQRLLDDRDPLSIFGMIVRQFRFLLLAREMLDNGYQEGEVTHALNIHPYVARKVTAQARRYSLQDLEEVYRRLLDIDSAIKTGKMEGELALDTFVTAFTA